MLKVCQGVLMTWNVSPTTWWTAINLRAFEFQLLLTLVGKQDGKWPSINGYFIITQLCMVILYIIHRQHLLVTNTHTGTSRSFFNFKNLPLSVGPHFIPLTTGLCLMYSVITSKRKDPSFFLLKQHSSSLLLWCKNSDGHLRNTTRNGGKPLP